MEFSGNHLGVLHALRETLASSALELFLFRNDELPISRPRSKIRCHVLGPTERVTLSLNTHPLP
jgi:hypothetical protein